MKLSKQNGRGNRIGEETEFFRGSWEGGCGLCLPYSECYKTHLVFQLLACFSGEMVNDLQLLKEGRHMSFVIV